MNLRVGRERPPSSRPRPFSAGYHRLASNPGLLVWSSPVLAVGYIVLLRRVGGLPGLEFLIAGIIGVAAVEAVSRRPHTALLAILIGMPFQVVVFSTLYHWGTPVTVLRPLGAWKEAMALAILAAAWRARRQRAGPTFDRIDHWAIGYVAVVGAYALAPQIASSEAPLDLSVRLTAFRANAGFVILFLAARHAPISGDQLRRLIKPVFAAAVIVGAVGIYEFFFSSSWNDFAVNRLGVSQYLTEVVDSPVRNPADLRTYSPLAGRDILRAGSVYFSPLSVGFALIIGFAIGCDRIVSGKPSQTAVVGLAAIAAGILATQTRTAIVAMAITGLLALRPARAREGRARVRLGLLLAAGAVLAAPLLASSGIVDRFVGAVTGEEEGAEIHQDSFGDSMDRLVDQPLGEGLGTSAGVGQRFDIDNVSVGENYYLQVGNETGVVSLVAFVGLVVAMTRRLGRLAAHTASTVLTSVRGAAVALGLGAFFLHIWIDLAVAWTFWGLVGAALGASERTTRA